jgi:hypothetical protein
VLGRITPASSAAATVNGLSVDPGSNVSVIARLRARRESKVERLFGLKAGRFAIARTSPVLTSSTTMPPAFARCCATAAFSSR